MSHLTDRDFTPKGLKVEGPYENDRNTEYSQLYKDIIREAYGVTDVIIAHHLTYVVEENRDGFNWQVVQEIPSADTLIFDHIVAQKIWGKDYRQILTQLVLEPISSRDQLLKDLYYNR
jgi:hypothetical protein